MNKPIHYGLSLFFLLGLLLLGVCIPRHETLVLIPTYTAVFCAYFFIVKKPILNEQALFSIGIVSRLSLFLALPSLSDDVYRFIWDGTQLHLGIDPYAHLPSELIKSELPVSLNTLYNKLNSPNYFTVYPPLNQVLFWISTSTGDHPLFATNILRAFILISDLGSFWLLKKLLTQYDQSPAKAYWYFLNPLVILEFTGNLHFEAFVILFVLMGIFFIRKKKMISAGFAVGGAIGMKLLPLIYLPVILFKLKKKGLIICVVAMTVAISTFLPLLNSALFSNMQKSLGLYFQSFEFNASIYFLIREIGFWIKGYNIIGTLGPWLAVISLVLILSVSIAGSYYRWTLPKTMLLVLSSYLLLATTVHPWYVLPLIPLGLLSGYYFPVVWSLLIVVTYAGYTPGGFELSGYWVMLEYFILFTFLFFEIRHKNESNIPPHS